MKKGVKILAIGSGIAAAGAAAVSAISYHTTKRLVKIALDREEPKSTKKSQKKLSGSAGQKELFAHLAECAEALENSGLQTVELESHDGVKLIGHWEQCETPERVIIAMHGWRSTWSGDFAAIADFWRRNHCSVLYAEQRGQGNSDGDYMGFGLVERYDCLDWIHWANENGCAGLPIYLGGISMGASTVLMAAGLELPENVHGIVADCGYTSPHEIWKHVVENNLHIPYGGITGSIANDMCRKKLQIGSKDYSCVEALQQCTVPVLFIHGTDDHFVPIEMTYENYKACASPKRLFVVPGAEHGMSYLVDKNGYEKAVKDFWKDFDSYVFAAF